MTTMNMVGAAPVRPTSRPTPAIPNAEPEWAKSFADDELALMVKLKRAKRAGSYEGISYEEARRGLELVRRRKALLQPRSRPEDMPGPDLASIGRAGLAQGPMPFGNRQLAADTAANETVRPVVDALANDDEEGAAELAIPLQSRPDFADLMKRADKLAGDRRAEQHPNPFVQPDDAERQRAFGVLARQPKRALVDVLDKLWNPSSASFGIEKPDYSSMSREELVRMASSQVLGSPTARKSVGADIVDQAKATATRTMGDLSGALAAAGVPGAEKDAMRLRSQADQFGQPQTLAGELTGPVTSLASTLAPGAAVGKVAQAAGAGAKLVQGLGTAAAVGTGAVQAGGGRYMDVLDRLGLSPEAKTVARTEAAGAGTITALTSVVPMSRLMRFLPPGVRSAAAADSKVGRVALDFLAEGTQEASEEGGGMLLQWWAENDPQAFDGWAARVGKAFGLGGFAGGVAGATGELASIGEGGPSRAQQLAKAQDLRRAQQFAREQADARSTVPATGTRERAEAAPDLFGPNAPKPPSPAPAAGGPAKASGPEGGVGAQAGARVTADERLEAGTRLVSPEGRVYVVGERVGKDQAILRPEESGTARTRQSSEGQLAAKGWRRAADSTEGNAPNRPESPRTIAVPAQQTGGGAAQAGPGRPASQSDTPPQRTLEDPSKSWGDGTGKPAPKMVEVKPKRQPGQAAKPQGPATPWSKRDIEDRIMKEYQNSAASGIEDYQDLADSESVNGGGTMTAFRGPIPTELKEAIEHRPELMTRLRANVKEGRATGADYLAELGVDRYVARLERSFEARIEKAKNGMRKDTTNPVARFLVALHDNLPKGRRSPKQELDASEIPVGTKFEIDGHEFRVDQDGDGYRVLKDGNTFPTVELDAFKQLPIDKGTLEKPAEAEKTASAEKPEPKRVQPAQGSLLGERFEGGTTGKQRGMFETGNDEAPDTREKDYPGIRRGESIEDYEKRMGTSDTGSMFKDDDIAPFAPATREGRSPWDNDLEPRQKLESEDGDITAEAPDPTRPTRATVAQKPPDRPQAVANELRKIRQRGAREANRDLEAQSIRQIMDSMSSALNMRPATVGMNRSKFRKALGFYRFIRGGIVLKKTDDVRTYAHEVGHALHEMLFPAARDMVQQKGRKARIQDVFPKAWRAELNKLGKALYGNTRPNVGGYETEGFAELFRYILTDPKLGQKLAPTAYNGMVKLMEQNHPEVMQAVLRFREQMKHTLSTTDPILRYLPKPPSWFERVFKQSGMRDLLDDFFYAVTDRHVRLNTLKRDLGIEEQLRRSKDPEFAMRRMKGQIYGDLSRIVEEGPWDVGDLGSPSKGKGLAEILKPIRPFLYEADGRPGAWQRYMIAKRIKEKRAQQFAGIFSQISDAELDKMITESEKRPGFKKAADDFQQLNEWFIREYAVGHDLITEEQAAQIIDKNQHYITFRHLDPTILDKPSGAGGSGGVADRVSGIRRFKGTSEDLIDPIGSFMMQMNAVVSNAKKNAVARNLTDLWTYQKTGIPEISRWIEKIDNPLEVARVGGDTFRAAVKKELTQQPGFNQLGQMDQDQIIDAIEQMEAPPLFQSASPSSKTRGKQLISVLRGGKREWYKVNDTRLYKTLSTMDENELAGVASWIQWTLTLPGRVLRAGATTRNPTFAVNNFLRDFQGAVLMSAKPVKDLGSQSRRLRGMAAAWKEGDVVKMMRASGVDMSSVYQEYTNAAGDFVPEKLFNDRGLGKAWKNIVDDPNASAAAKAGRIAGDFFTLGWIERLNNRIELMNRAGEFEAVRAGRTDTDSLLEAADAARDITLDFQRGGIYPRIWNRYIPFVNATILGTAKFARYVSSNLTEAGLRTVGLVLAPTIALMILNRDDEEYWKLSQSVRDDYYLFPLWRDETGRTVFGRIPKPHGFKAAAIAAERAFASQAGRDPTRPLGEKGDEDWYKSALRVAYASFMPSLSAGFFQPIIEAKANYSFYRDRPLETPAERRLDESARMNSTTSDFARAWGHWTNTSPIMIDHFLNGYGAGLARDVTKFVVDPITREIMIPAAVELGFSEPPPAPAKGIDRRFSPADLPIIRGFLARSSRVQTEAMIRWYDRLETLNAIAATAKRFEDREDEAGQAYAERYRKEHALELEKQSIMAAYDKAISELLKEYRSLSAEKDGEKAVQRANEIAEEIHQLIREGTADVRGVK